MCPFFCKSHKKHLEPVFITFFAIKNERNRTFFKEKTQADSYSIRQVFDEEKQDLTIFDAKANKYSSNIDKILMRNVVNTGS